MRITTAAPPASEELRSRERRYLISMAIRTACFIGAILVSGGWLRWVLIAGAVFLPYVAVVLANAMPAARREVDLRPSDWFGRELTGNDVASDPARSQENE